jgi:hypothetical protein
VLHARHADAEGLVTIVYDTEVWLSTKRVTEYLEARAHPA